MLKAKTTRIEAAESPILSTASTRIKPRKKSNAPTPALPYAADASKHQRILALLQRAEGATLAELQAATD